MSDKVFKPAANVPPYNDDFDAEKNYVQIVYNPGVAVQARELTQSQTVLQNQIANHGAYTFRDGTPISGAKIFITTKQPVLKISENDMNGQPLAIELVKGLTFVGQTSGQRITVIDIDAKDRYIYYSYLGGTIVDGEVFVSTTTPTRSFTMIAGSEDNALTATCSEGVMFINGYFINVSAQTLPVTVVENNSRWNIGFRIDTKFVTSADDGSLNDNASSTLNYNAPGADRYQVKATLVAYKDGEVPDDIKFVQGIVVDNQRIVKEQPNPLDGSALMDLLAKRTYDESGSYTVNPWKIQLEEHPTDLDKYIVSVQEGSGYICGYNVTTRECTDIVASKSRDIRTKTDITVFNDTGLYTYAAYTNGVLSAKGIIPLNTAVEVKSEANGAGNTLGEVFISAYSVENMRMRVYIKNAGSVIASFTGARSLVQKGNANAYINLNVNENDAAELYGQEIPAIYAIGEGFIESIASNSIGYYTNKTYSATSETSGNVITVLDSDTTVDFLASEGIIAIYNTTTGKQLDCLRLIATPDNSGTTSRLNISGAEIENATNYTVVVRTRIKNVSARQKIVRTQTDTLTMTKDQTELVLSKEDIFDIVSIAQTNNKKAGTNPDLKSLCTLDNGQTDYFYENGKLLNITSWNEYKANPDASTTYEVTYRYFEHNGTGPFTVNSYTSNVNKNTLTDVPDVYATVGTYRASTGVSYNLRDCYDFRVKLSALTDYAIPAPRTEIVSNVNKYLPRVDTVYVSSSGDFGIINGIPAELPVAPSVDANCMAIYRIFNEPYSASIKNISLTYVDNRRYTMKDIGTLDTRLTNAETMLSMTVLEQQSANMQITDENGLTRYKSGIFTDAFSSFNNSDYTNKEWDANIDSAEQSIRCNYNAEHMMFEYNPDNSTNAKLNNITVTVPYTTEVYTQNTYVTNWVNVQHYLFNAWSGALKLTPSVDTWVNDLGNFVVKTIYTEVPEPPATYKTWTNTIYREGHRMTGGVGYTNRKDAAGNTATYIVAREGAWSYGSMTTETLQGKVVYESEWQLNSTFEKMEKQDEFMRVRSVTYSCTGLRPGIKMKAKIDKFDLNLSSNTVDADGKLSGTFMIPEGVPTGTKEVLFYDDVPDGKPYTSSATATYSATGKTVWTNETQNYIRTWYDSGERTDTKVIASKTVQWDPVAQTIFVEEQDGVFIDSIDVYFYEKDDSINVCLYMVEVENGYPTTKQLPFSVCYKEAKDVKTSPTGTVPTNFKFQEPIYLSGETEYAFIIATTSYRYSVFISTLGEKDLNTGIGVYEQPQLGTMFLSQNARTWSPEQKSDVTFTMYKCKFNTTSDAIAVFDVNTTLADKYSVAMNCLVANDFTVSGTRIKYQYKWKSEANWTDYNNRTDIEYPLLKFIENETPVSMQIRAIMSTTNQNISPMIDTEQVYGIFCNNIVHPNDDIEFPFIAGTYVSKATTLENASTDIRVILDAICPNQSAVDVYVKTTTYKPVYVTQSTQGTLGIDTTNLELLDGKQLQVYYYNDMEKQLEPMSMCQMSGFDAPKRMAYLSQVGAPDEFKEVDPAYPNDTRYIGLDEKYQHILLLPVLSATNIKLNAWSASTSNYPAGTFVIHGGNIWKALKNITVQNVIPTVLSTMWSLVPSIKVVSKTQNGDEIEWRKMKPRENNLTSIQRAAGFNEYTYTPEMAIESEFRTFAIKLVMKSKDEANVPRVKNLRAIATI